jgi:predicted nucleotidyltransferase component of viral defense system
MIKKEELVHFQRKYNLPLSTVEKDYILGLILWGLSTHKILSNDWVFKGGTCLKKCYFGDYRFSEDLDYTLTPGASVEVEVIRKHLAEAFALTQDNFGLMITATDIELRPFPDKQGMFIQVKVPYQGSILSSGSLPKIKLDLSKEEIIVDKPSYQELIHPYSDQEEVKTKIRCYSIYELFAEKLRAFVERTRPRDLYDIVHLHEYFQSENLDKNRLIHIAQEKFKHKDFLFPEAFINLNERAIETAKADWVHMLGHQLYPLESIDVYIGKYKEIREWLKVV